MNQTDQAIQTFLDSMVAAGTANSTAIVLTAKHGQNPLDPTVVRLLCCRRTTPRQLLASLRNEVICH